MCGKKLALHPGAWAYRGKGRIEMRLISVRYQRQRAARNLQGLRTRAGHAIRRCRCDGRGLVLQSETVKINFSWPRENRYP